MACSGVEAGPGLAAGLEPVPGIQQMGCFEANARVGAGPSVQYRLGAVPEIDETADIEAEPVLGLEAGLVMSAEVDLACVDQ